MPEFADKLRIAREKFDKISAELSDPAVISDAKKYRELTTELSRLTPIADKYREYEATEKNLSELKSLAAETDDAELKKLAESDICDETDKKERLLFELKKMMVPRDPNDDKDVIVEIRAGAGGEEAALFASVLYRMYTMYAASSGFKTELIGSNETELGGYKEISFTMSGSGAYSRMKFESGVHRVQRVPETESQGRIHTSTVTVAVLPEADEVEVEIKPTDIKIETIKSSGAGGQHINKTESAVRLIHLATGITVECRDERSQYKNKDRAMKILRAKLFDAENAKRNEKIATDRKNQVGTGDRSERIRTYNYPQGRVTDHRIGYTSHSLQSFLDGKISDLTDSLLAADAAEKLKDGADTNI